MSNTLEVTALSTYDDDVSFYVVGDGSNDRRANFGDLKDYILADHTIGSDVQAYSSHLDQLVAASKSNGRFAMTDGSTFVTYAPATALGFLSSHLVALDGLSKTDGNFVVANGTTFVAESGATALASLGITAGAEELNYCTNVTSDIQAQIDAIDIDVMSSATDTATAGKVVSIFNDRSTNYGYSSGIATLADRSTCLGYFAGNSAGNTYTEDVFVGHEAGLDSDMNYSVVIGVGAGDSAAGDHNVFVGHGTTGVCGESILIGRGVSTAASAANSIVIGDQAVGTTSNQVVLGNSSITETILRGNILAGDSIQLANYSTPPSPVPYKVIAFTDAGVADDPAIGLRKGTSWLVIDGSKQVTFHAKDDFSSQCFFVANRDCSIRIASVTYETSNGAAINIIVTKESGTEAPGAGDTVLTVDGNSSANTVNEPTLSNSNLSKGDRLSFSLSTAETSLSGVTITLDYIQDVDT